MPTPLPASAPSRAMPSLRRGLRRLMAPWCAGQCEVCRTWSVSAVCDPCRERFAAPSSRCLRCAIDLPPTAQGGCCGACLRRPPPQSLTLAGLPYAYPWDGVIQRFKRHGATELAGLLVEPLAQAVQRHLARTSDGWPHLLVPVPLSQQRLAERGYDQAWELTKRLARQLALPADAMAIERIVDTPHQLALPRDKRLANVRGAFAVNPEAAPRLAGRRIAIVDDVMTTGATVAEVAATLRRAGAADVQVWVVARTPLQ